MFINYFDLCTKSNTIAFQLPLTPKDTNNLPPYGQCVELY